VPDNYVSLVVKANDQSKLDLDGLKARLAELSHTVATAKVDVNDKAGVAKLTAMNIRLERLNRQAANPNITLQGALRAEAQIAALDASLDHLNDKSASAGRSGLLGKILFGASGSVASLGGIGTTLINPITIGIGALAAVMAGPLIASFAPIIAGFAAFGAGAVGEITKVLKAHQKLMAAQQAYEKATTKAGRQSALKAEQQATEGLTGSEQGLLTMLGSLGKEFGKLEKAVQPSVIKAFAGVLNILSDLMPTLIPLAKAAGKAIDGFLNNIDLWLKSDSGKKFLKWMRTDGPHAIETFGRVMWDVVQGIGQTFSFLRNAGNTWWKNFDRVIHDASRIPQILWSAIQILADKLKINWDQMAMDALGFVLKLTVAFGHLPGRLGAPFRAASAAIRTELSNLAADTQRQIGRMQAAIDRLHGKSITILTIYRQQGFPGGVGPGSTGVGVAPVPSGSSSALVPASSVMSGAAAAAFARPFEHAHRRPYYGHERITNAFVPHGAQPPPPLVISNGAELIAILAQLLSNYARTHHGGSAQAAYGYGPG
jgi:hypothetical protein